MLKAPVHWILCRAVLALVLLGAAIAHAQQDRLVLNPPLSQAFPLNAAPDGVRLKYPVLLNERTVLGPDVVLRFIYVNPDASAVRGHGGGDGGAERVHLHPDGSTTSDNDEANAGFARSPRHSGGGAPAAAGADAPISSKDAKAEISTEVWTQPGLFRDALEEAAEVGTTVVYSAPGKAKPQSTMVDLPDGMLLAQVGGHVQVLGLTPDSRAGESGVQPGDEIRALDGAPAPASLTDFARDYLARQQQARTSGHSFALQVWRADESRLVTLQIAAPPSIPSFL